MRKALKLGLLICLLLIAVNLASAATLHGTVYDYSLQKVNNAFVTLGAEKDITENGVYSFEVGLGMYNISARFYDPEGKLVSSVTESIDITEEKAYVFDLVLFESIAEEELLFLETEQVLTDVEPTFLELKVKEGFNWIGIAILFVFLALVYVWMKRMKKIETKVKEVKEDRKKKEMIVKGEAEKVLEFIKKQERTTQKDIRNEFPSSEAKISLILTELETKGKIRKIKKGRGNIIIYNE